MPMDLNDNDLYLSMLKVKAAGGSIFYDRVPAGTVNATAGGTGTSRTSISTTYVVPNAAAEILAISPGVSPTAFAVADVLFAMVDIQGTSFKRQPQQVIAPVGGVTLSVGSMRITPQFWYTVRAPVGSNDQYDWGVTPLVANAHNFKAWVDVMYATKPSGDPTIFSQVSSVTAFKAVGATATGTLTLVNANQLYEVGTGLSPETPAVAQEVQILLHQLQCSALSPIQTFIYGQEAPAVLSATSGDSGAMQLQRYSTLGLKFSTPAPTLNYTSINNVAQTNNVTVAHMARYTSL